MPSEENNGYGFPILNGIATFMQGAIAVFTKASEWYRDNEENIKNFLIGFSNFSTCCSAIEKMAEHQIMFSDDISVIFADSICSTADVDALVEDYYFGNDEQHIKNVIRRCDTARQLKEYHNLFLETTDAYSRRHYHLACMGLFAIADGLMADISRMKDSTSFEKRIKSIEQKMADKIELDTIDRRTFFIHLQFDSLGDKLSNSVFGFSDFTKDEPDVLNRHWLLHGRTHKSYSRYDFLKILLWIDQLVFLDTIINPTTGGDEK